MCDLVRVLINASEKSANIARAIRREEELFSLLIEEKGSLRKNGKLVKDFKTLADVLIQATVRSTISTVFPEMGENIFGEESNRFTNFEGESICITIGENEEQTRCMLEKVLPDNSGAAKILANEIHRDVTVEDEVEISRIPGDLIDSYSNLGIWIDPIDATSEYIRGERNMGESTVVEDLLVHTEGGLHCVTVLLGVFRMDTGASVIGVVNQPFRKFSPLNKAWTGCHFWGVSMGSWRISNLGNISLQNSSARPPSIIMSDSEDQSVKDKLTQFRAFYAPGAGYKLLCVILGLVDFYLVSRKSTHFWDTCAPDAILRAVGGGIRTLGKVHPDSNSHEEISYNPNDPFMKMANYANIGGLFAYRDATQVNAFLETLQTSGIQRPNSIP